MAGRDYHKENHEEMVESQLKGINDELRQLNSGLPTSKSTFSFYRDVFLLFAEARPVLTGIIIFNAAIFLVYFVISCVKVYDWIISIERFFRIFYITVEVTWRDINIAFLILMIGTEILI